LAASRRCKYIDAFDPAFEETATADAAGAVDALLAPLLAVAFVASPLFDTVRDVTTGALGAAPMFRDDMIALFNCCYSKS
jgi:hypothetical protein